MSLWVGLGGGKCHAGQDVWWSVRGSGEVGTDGLRSLLCHTGVRRAGPREWP